MTEPNLDNSAWGVQGREMRGATGPECPTGHTTIGGDPWDIPRWYTLGGVKGEGLWRPIFCPDCGIRLSETRNSPNV